MIKRNITTLILFLAVLSSYCQNPDEYEVYALKYLKGKKVPAKEIAVGAAENDSVQFCFMFWLLKDKSGKNILVDAGYIDTSKVINPLYERPDLVLKQMNISTDDISDIIMTHPHWDHIGGITLFPKATIWMQKEDFLSFVGEAWQVGGKPMGFDKQDVRNIVEVNLQGRLKLVQGDDVEIMPGIRAYIGSKHTYENMYLVVNSNSKTNKILLASDATWYYYNLDNLLSVPTYIIDPKAYIENLKRMKTLVTNPDLIIPGHDDLIFSKFPKINDRIVKIGN
jgi:glyoxylase-like metal-dependent hydrolase (beta-lactamase superfamily II)